MRLGKNIFGKKNFETNDRVLSLMSRYTSGETKMRIVKLDRVIKNWRENNFFMEDLFGREMSQTATVSDYSSQALKNIKLKRKKQRLLAMHLANYSSHSTDEFPELTRCEIEIFLAVADTDDPTTISTCAISLSNVCSCPDVRTVLIDMNAIHKMSAMVPHFQTPNISRAAGILFYYLSCEREIEDRVYSAYFLALQTNCGVADVEIRLLSLRTLNNLLPSMERHRVCDLILASMLSQKLILEDDPVIFNEALLMILNMSVFNNLHSLMVDCDVLEMIAQAASRAVLHDNVHITMRLLCD